MHYLSPEADSCSPALLYLGSVLALWCILYGAPGYCHKSKCHKKEPSPTVYKVKDENTLARHLQFNSTLCSQTSLVVQWLRVCLLMQGTWVWSLVQEDSTCCGATKPLHHNHWACALEPTHHSKRSHHSEKPTHLTQREAPVTATRERKLAHSKKDPEQPKINLKFFKWMLSSCLICLPPQKFLTISLRGNASSFSHVVLFKKIPSLLYCHLTPS